jgi:LPS-assembly lipoprotein
MFNDVEIANIPDQSGQYLRNALMDRLYSAGRPANPRYTLTIAPITESETDLDTTKSSTATRTQLRLTTTMTLTEIASGKTVLTRDLTAVNSYNVLQSQFTTRVTEQDARQNSLDNIARQAEAQLALYFRQPA